VLAGLSQQLALVTYPLLYPTSKQVVFFFSIINHLHRKVLAGSVAICVVGNFMYSFAYYLGPYFLLASRFLTGFGAGMLFPSSCSLLNSPPFFSFLFFPYHITSLSPFLLYDRYFKCGTRICCPCHNAKREDLIYIDFGCSAVFWFCYHAGYDIKKMKVEGLN
jgi:hypothetical protein